MCMRGQVDHGKGIWGSNCNLRIVGRVGNGRKPWVGDTRGWYTNLCLYGWISCWNHGGTVDSMAIAGKETLFECAGDNGRCFRSAVGSTKRYPRFHRLATAITTDWQEKVFIQVEMRGKGCLLDGRLFQALLGIGGQATN